MVFGKNRFAGGLTGNNPVDFMMRSNPFTQEKSSNPFLKNFTAGMAGFGKDEEGDSFAKRFAKGFMKSYRPQEKSSQDLIYDQLAANLGARKGGLSGLAQPVAEGLTMVNDDPGDPVVAPGTPGSPGLLQTVGVPLLGAFICDIRAKEDVAPLCESEVNDVLSECAYFVKNLNECS